MNFRDYKDRKPMKAPFKADPMDDAMAIVAVLVALTMWAAYLGVIP